MELRADRPTTRADGQKATGREPPTTYGQTAIPGTLGRLPLPCRPVGRSSGRVAGEHRAWESPPNEAWSPAGARRDMHSWAEVALRSPGWSSGHLEPGRDCRPAHEAAQ